MQLLYSEILDKINKASSDEEQINLLKQFGTKAMKGCLKINFNKEINFLLPEGNPPFNRVDDKPEGIDHSFIELEYDKFYIWFDSQQPINKLKRERLFIDMLERLHVKEADILLAIKNHALTDFYPNIKFSNVIKAYWPDMRREIEKAVLNESLKDVYDEDKEMEDLVNEAYDETTLLTDEPNPDHDLSFFKEIKVAHKEAAKVLGIQFSEISRLIKQGKLQAGPNNELNALDIYYYWNSNNNV